MLLVADPDSELRELWQRRLLGRRAVHFRTQAGSAVFQQGDLARAPSSPSGSFEAHLPLPGHRAGFLHLISRQLGGGYRLHHEEWPRPLGRSSSGSGPSPRTRPARPARDERPIRPLRRAPSAHAPNDVRLGDAIANGRWLGSAARRAGESARSPATRKPAFPQRIRRRSRQRCKRRYRRGEQEDLQRAKSDLGANHDGLRSARSTERRTLRPRYEDPTKVAKEDESASGQESRVRLDRCQRQAQGRFAARELPLHRSLQRHHADLGIGRHARGERHGARVLLDPIVHQEDAAAPRSVDAGCRPGSRSRRRAPGRVSPAPRAQSTLSKPRLSSAFSC